MLRLAMLAVLAASDTTPLPVRAPTPTPQTAWYVLRAADVGGGAPMWELGAGLEQPGGGMSVVARYVQPAPRAFAPADIMLTWRRDLDVRDSLDLAVWRGLNRAGGGLDAGITFRRVLGSPPAKSR